MCARRRYRESSLPHSFDGECNLRNVTCNLKTYDWGGGGLVRPCFGTNLGLAQALFMGSDRALKRQPQFPGTGTLWASSIAPKAAHRLKSSFSAIPAMKNGLFAVPRVMKLGILVLFYDSFRSSLGWWPPDIVLALLVGLTLGKASHTLKRMYSRTDNSPNRPSHVTPVPQFVLRPGLHHWKTSSYLHCLAGAKMSPCGYAQNRPFIVG